MRAEIYRQPIQQLRMARHLSLVSKIFRCFHQSYPKKILPETIDCYTSGQWMIFTREPLGKSPPVFWKFRRKRKDRFRSIGKYLFAWRIVATPLQYMAFPS